MEMWDVTESGKIMSMFVLECLTVGFPMCAASPAYPSTKLEEEEEEKGSPVRKGVSKKVV